MRGAKEEIFETPDPAAAPAAPSAPPTAAATPGIDRAAHDPRAAMERFAGGSVAPLPDRAEYASAPGRLASVGAEPPAERLMRLRREVAAFLGELDEAVKEDPRLVVDEAMTAAHLGKELQRLQEQLDRAEKTAARAPAPAVRTKKLLADIRTTEAALRAARNEGDAAGDAAADDDAAATGVRYELFYSGKVAGDARDQAVGDLETRIAALERSLGSDPIPGGHPTLTAALNDVGRAVSVVSEAQGDALERRIAHITSQLDTLAVRYESAGPSKEYEKKVGQIFETLDRWDSVAQQVPMLVERLTAVRTLHESAAAMHGTLAAITDEQKALRAALAESKELAAAIETGFDANMRTIESNIEALGKKK